MTPDAGHMDFERMLRMALAPVDPPESLQTRVETTLQELTDAAVVGASAGTALVVLRVRQQQRRRAAQSRNPLDLAQRTLRAAAGEARKLAHRD